MRRALLATLVALAVLAPVAEGRVLVIGLDGTRFDTLQQLMAS